MRNEINEITSRRLDSTTILSESFSLDGLSNSTVAGQLLLYSPNIMQRKFLVVVAALLAGASVVTAAPGTSHVRDSTHRSICAPRCSLFRIYRTRCALSRLPDPIPSTQEPFRIL